MPQITEVWRNERELADGRLLEVFYKETKQRGGYRDQAEVDSETYFRLSGELVDQQDLPSEVTAEIIAKLIDSAVRVEPDGD